MPTDRLRLLKLRWPQKLNNVKFFGRPRLNHRTALSYLAASRLLRPALLILTALLVVLGQPNARAENDLTFQLMLESGLISQLNILHKSLAAQLEYAIKQDPKLSQISAQQKTRVLSWVHASYSPEKLISSIHDYYYDQLSDQDIEQILRWIRSETGNRFTEMEKMASGTRAEEDMQIYRVNHPLTQVAENRLKLILRLNTVTKVSDSALVVKLTEELALGLIKQQSRHNKQSVDSIMKLIGKQRDILLKKIMPELKSDMIYMYRNASDLELQSYISFAESSIGVRYHNTMLSAFNNALIESSEAFGKVLLEAY